MYTKPISPSSKKLFKECPKRWEWVYVHGNREESGDAAKRGTDLHEKLEQFFLGEPYPQDKALRSWEPFMNALREGAPSPEAKLAVNAQWEPVEFDCPTAYYRGITDLKALEDSTLNVWDWKSGRVYEEAHKSQGEDYVCIAPPVANKYVVRFVYLDHYPKVTTYTYTAQEREGMILALRAEVERIRTVDVYEATPGDACKWCPLSWRKGGECKDAP
jgi:hypothetical protein